MTTCNQTLEGGPSQMRRLLTILLAIVAATTGTFYFFPRWSGAPAETSYRLAKAAEGEIVATVNATGTINPTTTVIVGSQPRARSSSSCRLQFQCKGGASGCAAQFGPD